MARERKMVPFGFEAEKETIKGTVFVMDPFDDSSVNRLKSLLSFFEDRHFMKVVLYPFHDETLKRMGIAQTDTFYKRVKKLEENLADAPASIAMTIDQWEGRRKKYTPMDSAIKFLTEKYKAPHFLCLTKEIANKFAAYQGFDDWIREVRLFIEEGKQDLLHPKLHAYAHRLEIIKQR